MSVTLELSTLLHAPGLLLIPSSRTLCYVLLLPSLQDSLQVSPAEPTAGKMLPDTLGNPLKATITLTSRDLSICLLLPPGCELLGPRGSSFHLGSPASLVQCLLQSSVSAKVCGIKITIKQLWQIESLLCQAPRKPFLGTISWSS